MKNVSIAILCFSFQNVRDKPVREDDADSACSVEGSTSDSGRGSHDDTMPRLNSTSSQNPPIPQRLPVTRSPRLSDAERLQTRDLGAGLHAAGHPTVNNLSVPNTRHLYTDNKKYYDERVFAHGAAKQSRDILPSYNSAALSPAYPLSSRLHVPSPSPSLQHQPGHDANPAAAARNIYRQRSLNIPELPPRKSVHYCSQV